MPPQCTIINVDVVRSTTKYRRKAYPGNERRRERERNHPIYSPTIVARVAELQCSVPYRNANMMMQALHQWAKFVRVRATSQTSEMMVGDSEVLVLIGDESPSCFGLTSHTTMLVTCTTFFLHLLPKQQVALELNIHCFVKQKKYASLLC